MPEQDTTPDEQQILYVGVVGPKTCGNCNYVIAELEKRGVKATKENLDRLNPSPLHQKLRDEAAKKGEKEAPMLYTVEGDGEPKLIGAGRTMYNILKITGREKDLQDQRAKQEAMANA
jgi:hypothetical protein